MAEVKHGGCYKCGSKEYPVLWAVHDPEVKATSVAVCPTRRCIPADEVERLVAIGNRVPA
jgi:hypothetical protein